MTAVRVRTVLLRCDGDQNCPETTGPVSTTRQARNKAREVGWRTGRREGRRVDLCPDHARLLGETLLGIQHGTEHTYGKLHCRCDECRLAHARYSHQLKQVRVARLKATPTLVKHGLYSTYSNWGCRCEACSLANITRCAAYRRHRDS